MNEEKRVRNPISGGCPRIFEYAGKNKMQEEMDFSRALSKYLFAALLILPAASPSWSAGPAGNGFLRKRDFRISFDTAYTFKGAGKVSPASVDFDFSASGDAGTQKVASGRVFSTAWKAKCTDDRSNCDFFLTVLQQAKDSASLPVNGSEPHARVYGTGSKAAIES